MTTVAVADVMNSWRVVGNGGHQAGTLLTQNQTDLNSLALVDGIPPGVLGQSMVFV